MRVNGITAYKGGEILHLPDLLYFIVYNLNDGGIGSILTAQGGMIPLSF
jgi:hypothetical protein